jgi:hypothetical protein
LREFTRLYWTSAFASVKIQEEWGEVSVRVFHTPETPSLFHLALSPACGVVTGAASSAEELKPE